MIEEGYVKYVGGREYQPRFFFTLSSRTPTTQFLSLPNGFGATHALDDTVEFEDSYR